ncbi:hypothetical protein HanXRQr2_Chr04g0189121 [Helianthus annuus]|uniref:Uncharacterized protein n=1 Tax=Helianthus annuus TaxID=4232 RepID=A0A9K3JAW3_HELAN|nr:hypothetical protein HanXRQr2_Chr04g0189121 [Helianthus annuus]
MSWLFNEGLSLPDTLSMDFPLILPDSLLVAASNCVPFKCNDPDRIISLYTGSVKQLLPVDSNSWHRSSVRLTKPKAACLDTLLPTLLGA